MSWHIYYFLSRAEDEQNSTTSTSPDAMLQTYQPITYMTMKERDKLSSISNSPPSPSTRKSSEPIPIPCSDHISSLHRAEYIRVCRQSHEISPEDFPPFRSCKTKSKK
eukprot:TRINITY_DN15882_c0_g1::TRINITY_DN15882_c0_g1_i1::g.22540::m.22540 TRINITY_DN15882_c0_g1::TRINITY_DN15882_c0_g1_i1::g.22540  ORF type:complete len:108 (-),score=14.75 TRINITY_DN15882_c0_g1_i1:620-943(-)